MDFSGRTVISPDPNLRIDQVAIPDRVAKILTYPERVNEHNIDYLRECIRRGPDEHPGANYVQLGSNGMKKFLRFADREYMAQELRVGDIVERHLRDEDIVLFNRQPSLHKLSIMSHHAKIRPWRTFRFNECVCNPYNADFDGDEMNLHVPQTEEARAEARQLMGVKANLVTPRNGEPLIAAIQDFITASYLLTKKDLFYGRAAFAQHCAAMGDALDHIDLPPPAILKPEKLWTGKQILSLLIRPNRRNPIRLTVEGKGRSFSEPTAWDRKEGKVEPDLCPNDGYLIIRNSQIMCGALDKASVGDGNKNSVFYSLLRDYGADDAAKAMHRLAKLCSRWLGTRGFSIGVEDVSPGPILEREKASLVESAYAKCLSLIDSAKLGQLELQAGCDMDQTLEARISGVLSKVRDGMGERCMQELGRHNSPLIMSVCGSKGSKINVSQMVACVGQQIISGSRIPDGFVGRSLPHFPRSENRVPAAKGFVRNSFYSGLTPTEFFFHAVSGREGLVDTAVKTAETGYMQRRLMKALEDLTTHYDLSVRNAAGGVVQFQYGYDGLDPVMIEDDNTTVALPRAWVHAQWLHYGYEDGSGEVGTETETGSDNWLLAGESGDDLVGGMRRAVDSVFSTSPYTRYCSETFLNSLRSFLDNAAHERERCSLSIETSVMKGKKESSLSSSPMASKSPYPPLRYGQVKAFLTKCLDKYMRTRIEPGTAVGAVGAQSIGEPGTQMTLKTFHFAGVASMNITLGVPRIKEIINASKLITTPIISSAFEHPTSLTAARIVKGRVETTRLGDVTWYLDEVYTPEGCFLDIRIDLETLRKLQLETTLGSIADSIQRTKKLKLPPGSLNVLPPNRIRIHCSTLGSLTKGTDPSGNGMYYGLQSLKRALPQVIIKGIPSVKRAVISEDQGGTATAKRYKLAVEGYGLQEVMGTEGVIGTQTTSNHIIEVQKVLGIEAARHTIVHEVEFIMENHGMSIDRRHVMLLGDVMTYKGEVLGITRFGVAKMKDSVLMLASFEKTTDHLFDAALYGKRDTVDGVSECIIMGIPMPIGTGMFKLLRDPVPQERQKSLQKMGDKEKVPMDMVEGEEQSYVGMKRELLFDLPDYHPKLLMT